MKSLIIKLSSLGDIIHALPIVHVLRENFPDSQIDWLVGKKGFELLSQIKEVDNVYLLSLKNIFLIQKQKYDYVIDVQGLFKSGFLSRLSLGKTTIGFKGAREFAEMFYDKKINVGNLLETNKHVVEMNLELVSDLAKNLKVKFLIPKIIKPDNIDLMNLSKKRSILVFPSTTWQSKLWPMDYWFELVKNVSKDFKVFVCASKSELKIISPLLSKLDASDVSYENLIGKTKIKDLIYLIQNADLVIGLDSAGLHLAAGVRNDFGRPEIIGIYGPTSPLRSGPYGQINNCLYLSSLECIACREKKCPLGHHKCMRDILPRDVSEKINKLSMKIC